MYQKNICQSPSFLLKPNQTIFDMYSIPANISTFPLLAYGSIVLRSQWLLFYLLQSPSWWFTFVPLSCHICMMATILLTVHTYFCRLFHIIHLPKSLHVILGNKFKHYSTRTSLILIIYMQMVADGYIGWLFTSFCILRLCHMFVCGL